MRKLSPLFILIFALGVFGQNSQTEFRKFSLKGIGSIMIPSTMELQAGSFKEYSDKITNEVLAKKGFEISGDSIEFQPVGLNEFKESKTYARVMIDTTAGKKGEFPRIPPETKLSKAELDQIDAIYKKQIETATAGIGLKITRWDGISIANVNGRGALKIAYVRQVNENPPVYVEVFSINDDDRIIALTISYRVADAAAMWKQSLEAVRDSFTIAERK